MSAFRQVILEQKRQKNKEKRRKKALFAKTQEVFDALMRDDPEFKDWLSRRTWRYGSTRIAHGSHWDGQTHNEFGEPETDAYFLELNKKAQLKFFLCGIPPQKRPPEEMGGQRWEWLEEMFLKLNTPQKVAKFLLALE